jgi:hypothetical protein
MKLEFFDTFLKNTQISIVAKIHAVGAELIHADGWTDGQTDMMLRLVSITNLMHNSFIL